MARFKKMAPSHRTHIAMRLLAVSGAAAFTAGRILGQQGAATGILVTAIGLAAMLPAAAWLFAVRSSNVPEVIATQRQRRASVVVCVVSLAAATGLTVALDDSWARAAAICVSLVGLAALGFSAKRQLLLTSNSSARLDEYQRVVRSRARDRGMTTLAALTGLGFVAALISSWRPQPAQLAMIGSLYIILFASLPGMFAAWAEAERG